MERVVSKEDVILKLCPEDYITVTANKKYWMTKIKGLGEILIEDRKIDVSKIKEFNKIIINDIRGRVSILEEETEKYNLK